MVMQSFAKIDLILGRRRRNLPCLQSATGDTKGLETRSYSCGSQIVLWVSLEFLGSV